MDFTANGLAMGTHGSELQLTAPGTVHVTARVASLLPERRATDAAPSWTDRPYWTPEHARVPGTRDVVVELVQNGQPVATRKITADGTLTNVSFDVPVSRSSWIALRVLGSAHTNPIFVIVGGRPIRASRKSADWCLRAVDQCWSSKMRQIRRPERDAAQAAYDHARARYRQILGESDVD
jgi:hypothetical protein